MDTNDRLKTDRVANLLGALSIAVTDTLFGEIAGLGFSADEASSLVTLASNPGLRIRDLSEILRHSHAGTVRLVGRLVSRGLVQKAEGRDRREVRLSLTSQGDKTVAAIFHERRKRLRQIVESIPENERNAFGSVLEALLTHVAVDDLTTFRICRLCDESDCNGEACPVESCYRGVWP